MNQYNPDEFKLSKPELLRIFEILIARWDKNPKVNKNFVRKMKLDLTLFRSRFVKEEDLPYAWIMFCELFDELRSLNDRKGHKELEKLNPAMEKAFETKLATVPEEKPKAATVSFLSVWHNGGMRE